MLILACYTSAGLLKWAKSKVFSSLLKKKGPDCYYSVHLWILNLAFRRKFFYSNTLPEDRYGCLHARAKKGHTHKSMFHGNIIHNRSQWVSYWELKSLPLQQKTLEPNHARYWLVHILFFSPKLYSDGVQTAFTEKKKLNSKNLLPWSVWLICFKSVDFFNSECSQV